jgi:hypothetical protein
MKPGNDFGRAGLRPFQACASNCAKSTAGRPCKLPLPSKYLIWQLEPITGDYSCHRAGFGLSLVKATVRVHEYPDGTIIQTTEQAA